MLYHFKHCKQSQNFKKVSQDYMDVSKMKRLQGITSIFDVA